jgi:hypothetical protein
MFKAASLVKQIMEKLYDSVPEEGKILIITKIILNLMKQNKH